MQITISGQHLEIGDSLRQHINDTITQLVGKYCEYATSAHVFLVMDKPGYIRTEVNIHSGKKSFIAAHAIDYDAYRSVDHALARMETQLRKYKKKLKEHHHSTAKEVSFLSATKYVVQPYDEELEEIQEYNPVIVAEKIASIETLSIHDAVMRLELNSHGTYVFINSGTDKINVLFYRRDGNIAWMDLGSVNTEAVL
jgi:ribosomal subunit interface protein